MRMVSPAGCIKGVLIALPLVLLSCSVAHCEQVPLAVFGHKIPDTDAISAAIVYTWELNARNISATAYRLGDLNPETAFVLKTLRLEAPPMLPTLQEGARVAIVDTNNPAELPDGVEAMQIHSIVDHHRLSGLKTAEPLEIDIRALCSTGSILFSRAKAFGLSPPKHIAALMLSSILSDSLEFRSPTTTSIDKVYAEELAEMAGIEIHAYAEQMLDAKAQISHMSPRELVMMDSKVATLGGKRLRISVLELTKTAPALSQKDALVQAQLAVRSEEGLDDVLLFVIDILNRAAVFIASSDTAGALVEQAWKTKLSADGTVVLPGVLSRKKQIIPSISKACATEL